MYTRPAEYIKELKKRIDELKAELAEIEPIYNFLLKSIESANASVESKSCVSTSEKIAAKQRERHKRERDSKVPFIKRCLAVYGPSSLVRLSQKLRMTPGAIKKIVEENPDIFRKNSHNNLWELI